MPANNRCLYLRVQGFEGSSKESWPKGLGFGLPLKEAVLLKAVQVKSV
jgi:hypothetical protein